MDVRLNVLDQGTGEPPVVLTHGWADDASVWSGVAADLAADHRVVTWDLRGHGASDVPPPGEYSREHALGDLERVVAQAGAPVVLGGHSLGGYLSLAHALRHPEQVVGLVLVAAGPGFRNPDAMAQWNESVRASAPKLAIPPGQEEISIHTDSWVIDHLGDITAPVLVVVGERDKRFVASAGVFEKYLDVRATVIVPDAGHAVHRKHPAEVAAAIRDFTAGLR
jgi:pimeloyl-ACP methyl ester carboxylesterase